MSASLAQTLAKLREDEAAKVLGDNPETLAALRWDWRFWARPEQLAPKGDWLTWLILSGRGFGKTEAGAQWVRQRVKDGASSIALIAETQKDLEEVMVARLLAISPPNERPQVRFKPVRLQWPNGAVGLGYNGTEPDQLRGPEFDTAWIDELAKFRRARETWDMLQFTMRLADPRVLVTTTPRPIPLLKDIMANRATMVTRGSTFDNADNLAPAFIHEITERYGGTRLGRQEIDAEILDDVPGALWTRAMLDVARVDEVPEMARVVVAVDPSGTDGDDEGDDIGIVVVGRGVDGRGYVLEDATCKLSPEGWSRRAVQAYYRWQADLIVAEVNYGGAMVGMCIRQADGDVPFKEQHSSRGKHIRAEPVSALFEQGRMSMLPGMPDLEDEMLLMTAAGYMGERSPNRLDAMVFAVKEAMLPYERRKKDTTATSPPPVANAWRR